MTDDQCTPSVYLVYTQCTPKLRKRRGNSDDDKSIKDDKSIFREHLLVAKSGDGSKVSLILFSTVCITCSACSLLLTDPAS